MMDALTFVKELQLQARDMDTRKEDYTVEAKDLFFNEDADMLLPPTTADLFGTQAAVKIEPLQINDRAFSQMCGKMGKVIMADYRERTLPENYLRALPAGLRADLLNSHAQAMGTEKWLVRTYEDRARAVLSDRYGQFDNSEILDLLVQAMEADDGLKESTKPVRCFLDEDAMHVKIVWPNVTKGKDGGPYGIGFYVGNGEVGNYRARIYPVVQRHTCTNSIILRKEAGFEMYHKGDITAKRVMFKASLLEVFQGAGEVVQKMIEAEEEQLPQFSDILAGMTKQYNWSDREKMAVAAGTEGKTTRGALVNGVTYMAHTLYGDNHDTMVEWEMVGGDLLVAPDSVFSRARRMAEVERKA